jgi:hypothetical protein
LGAAEILDIWHRHHLASRKEHQSLIASPGLSKRRLAALGRGLTLLLLLALAGSYSVHLGVDQMWDLKNYHLYNPYVAQNDRYLYDVAPAQLQSYLNPTSDYLLLFLVQNLNQWPRLIAFVSGTVHGLNLFFIALIVWELLGSINVVSRALRFVFSAVAVFTAATGAGFSPLIGTFTGDLFVSIPVLAALYVVLRELRVSAVVGRVSSIALLLAGGLLGVAVALKLTMAIYTLAMMPVILLLPRRDWIRSAAMSGVAFIVGVALAGGQHFYRMFVLFQNPLFPYFNDRFKSSYWEAAGLTDTRFLPKSLSDWLFYPLKWATDSRASLVSELSFRDARVSLAFLSIAILLATWLYRRHELSEVRATSRAVGGLIIFVVVAYVVWLFMFSIYRYLIVVELLSGVLIVVAAAFLLRNVLGLVLALSLSALCIASAKPLEWGHGRFGQRYIGVDAPDLSIDTLVVIAGADPVSYVIPLLDGKIRWVSVSNNFLNLDQHNKLIESARQIVQSHSGPIRIFDAGGDPGNIAARLGLRYSATDCAEITSTIESKPYRLCRAER